MTPSLSCAAKEACPGSTPISPPKAGIVTASTGLSERTVFSGVTIVRRSLFFSMLLFLLPAAFYDLFYPAGHPEHLLGQVVETAAEDLLETADGLFERHVLAGAAGELFGHRERLRHELLYLAGPVNGLLVLVGQLVDAQDRDDILQLLVALQDLLHAAGRVVMLVADHAGVEDAGGGVQRVDGRVNAQL